VQISGTFTSTIGQESPLFSGQSTANSSATVIDYYGWGGAASLQTTETLASAVMPTAGTIDNLYVLSPAAPGTGRYDYYVLKNGTPTTLTCFLTGSGAPNTTCNDTNGAHAITIAAGDTLSFESCPAGNSLTGCLTGTTPTAGAPKASVRWIPTISNEALVFQTGGAGISVSANRFLDLAGISGNSATETDNRNIAPVAMTIKKLRVIQSTWALGTSRTDNLLSGGSAVGSPGNIACVINGAATPATCNDSTNSYGAAAGELLSIQTVPSGTQTAVTYHKTGAVVTVP
jgi:hypothetical protein